LFLAICASWAAGVPALRAQPEPCIEFDTELTSLSLSGGPIPMPLASDPGNILGDSVEGYGFVDSRVDITLSSQRDPAGPASPGSACAVPGGPDGRQRCEPRLGCPAIDPINPEAFEGQPFAIASFFDVAFDITVTDVDSRPGRDYIGQADGASFSLQDNGPADLQSFGAAVFSVGAPNFGLIPPPAAAPYIGHFLVELPLGVDVNGNGENDKIKFTLATHSVGDMNRQFIVLPDGTVLDEFDSAAFLEGALVDESADPPFAIGRRLPSGLPDPAAFGGPASATSAVVNPLPDADGDGVFDGLDQCPASNLDPTVVVGGCDSGVGNVLAAPGCTISDLVAGLAAGARNHGAFVSRVAHLLGDLEDQGVISGSDKGSIQSCAARSRIGKK
jgi:hypothetical protein